MVYCEQVAVLISFEQVSVHVHVCVCVRVYVCVFVVNKYSILLSIVAFTDSLCKLSVQNNAVTDSN